MRKRVFSKTTPMQRWQLNVRPSVEGKSNSRAARVAFEP